MSSAIDKTEDQVLDDFLAEAAQDRPTLELYLKRYPEHAGALLDLFTAITLTPEVPAASAAPADESWLGEAVGRLRRRLSAGVPDPFQSLTPQAYAAVRTRLGVRSATLTGFRDRQVELASVPTRFLQQLAAALGASVDTMRTYLAQPPRLAVQSYRADSAPQAQVAKVSFRTLLAAANEPPEVRDRLLSEADG